MYVCIEVALCGMPMERAIQLGQGEGPIGIVGPISQPRGYQWSRVTHADMYSHKCMCFPYQLLL